MSKVCFEENVRLRSWSNFEHVAISLEFMISRCSILRIAVLKWFSKYPSFTDYRNPKIGHSHNPEFRNRAFHQVSKSTTPEFVNSSIPGFSKFPTYESRFNKMSQIKFLNFSKHICLKYSIVETRILKHAGRFLFLLMYLFQSKKKTNMPACLRNLDFYNGVIVASMF